MISSGCNEVPKPGGGAYWSGDKNDHRDFKDQKDPNAIMKNDILREIINCFRVGHWFREDLATLFDLANSGKITPKVWKTLPLSEAAQAHQFIEARAVMGKIILRVAYQE